MNAQEYLKEWEHGEKVMLFEKVAALERLVTELALIAMEFELDGRRGSQLNKLLDKLKYAGLEEEEASRRKNEEH